MRRALAVPAVCLAMMLTGCAHTAWVLKEPVKEYSEGNYIFGTVMLACLPVMVPIFMVADAFELLNVSEQDVAVIAQAGQDYVTARAAQDQANAQAQAQAQAAMQQQIQQQQYQQQLAQQQAQQQAQARAQPAPQPVAMQQQAAPSGPSAQERYMEMQREQVAASNARIQADADRLREENKRFQAKHANASKCLSLVPMAGSLYGGFVNNCGYKVNVTWCNDGATGQGLGNFSDAIDCRKNSFASTTVGANDRVAAHTNAPRVYWMACKSPYLPLYGKFTGDGVLAECKD